VDGIKVTCQCGRILTAPASHAGQKGKCPACGAHFIIPLHDQTAPAPPLEPPHSQPETAAPAPVSRKPFPAKAVAITGGALALVAAIAIAAILLFSGGGEHGQPRATAPGPVVNETSQSQGEQPQSEGEQPKTTGEQPKPPGEQPASGPLKLNITETSLGKIVEGIIPLSLHVGRDSKRVAYAVKQGEKWLVVVDGVEGKEYDGIGECTPIFSPDSKRVAYVAKRGEKWFAVVDGVEGKEYDNVVDFSLEFSPDSRRFAYAAKRGEKYVAIVDGVEGKEYDNVVDFSLEFSPDSRRFAYAAKRGEKYVAIIDGVEGKEYDYINRGIGSSVFSPDSKRVAYAGQRGKKCFAVVDGVESKGYDDIAVSDNAVPGSGTMEPAVSDNVLRGSRTMEPNFRVFSPDSRHVAYRAKRGGKWLVVRDGAEGKEYDSIGDNLIFSDDSYHLTYSASQGDKSLVVVDGVESTVDDRPVWRTVESTGDDEPVWKDATEAGVDEAQGPTYSVVLGSFTYSPGRDREAHIAVRDKKHCVVVDGVKGKEYDGVNVGTLAFSPDSRRFAYAATHSGIRGGKTFAVVDGVEGKEYDWVGAPVFSPDSKHVAYEAQRDGKLVVVVDGVEGREYNVFVEGSRLVFDSPIKLHFLVWRNNEIFLVEIEICQ